MSSNAESFQPPSSPPHVPAQEQARRQGVGPTMSMSELIHPEVWESDEELGEFLSDLYASRKVDLL